ncbi:CLUMA_CG017755, isoform A [Clunio marinus]|uniref:CLUMA_CG017755, isoform A n=1 Tax=Clunio marinus TaxID=568069 RepID=A0A1J1IWM9_9DIPT|nr:CLUMA_CG017755, isoform A [Clunio marinus]
MSFVTNFLQVTRRQISTTSFLSGKKNFRKFLLYNKRGTRIFKKYRHISNPDIPIDLRGLRETGIRINGEYKEIPEMIPELIVPDLTDCKFKPYVSYKTLDVVQSEFTSQDLFNAIYAGKILNDFKNDNLNEDGTSKEPSEEEQLTADEAYLRARKTGSDIF